LRIVLAGKQMMLFDPNLPNLRPALLRGPIAAHQLTLAHADRTTAPHSS